MYSGSQNTFSKYADGLGWGRYSSPKGHYDEFWWKWRLPNWSWWRKELCTRCHAWIVMGHTLGETCRRDNRAQVCSEEGNMMNGIAAHAKRHKHEVDWEGTEVLQQEPRYWKRRVLEAVEIQRHAKNTNLGCGLKLDPIWTPFLSSWLQPKLMHSACNHNFNIYPARMCKG